MDQVIRLTAFYEAIAQDNRIGATHISTYMALFLIWHYNHFENPISITRQEVMHIAKITGRSTYHRCIHDLQAYGFIRYVPSFNPCLRSLVYMQQMKV